VGDSHTKKQILAGIGSNLTLLDKKLRIEALKPFQLIADFNSHASPENEWIEPKRNGSAGPQKVRRKHPFSTGLRDLKEDRTSEPKSKCLVKSVYTHFRKRAG
jgi:hypothetical protein